MLLLSSSYSLPVSIQRWARPLRQGKEDVILINQWEFPKAVITVTLPKIGMNNSWKLR
jgi:hypothetical protein